MALITVSGKMMLGSDSERLEQIVGELLGDGVRDFVVDMAALTHIDSTGIGRFIASYNKIMHGGGESLRMAAASGAVRSAFKVTKLDTIFQFYETVDKAQAA